MITENCRFVMVISLLTILTPEFQVSSGSVIAGQHSLDYPPSFLFPYLKRLVRNLVYLPYFLLEDN